jgi:hypothetical protein
MSVLGWWPMAMKQPLSAARWCAPSRALQAHAGHAAASPSTSSSVCTGAARSCRRDLVHQLVDQDRLGAELVAPVDQVHLAGDVRQVQRLLDRGVAAADHADRPAAVEEAVAGGAAADAAAHEGLLDGRPRYLAEAPVAMISASQV